MTLQVDEDSLTQGVLTLVVTLVEVIQDALETQAIRRIEGGSLTVEEQDRLGAALLELDRAMERLKQEHGISKPVADLRRGLDDVVEDLLDGFLQQPEQRRGVR
jgi:type II secretory pathway predicted ATPase ExeA